MELEKINQLTTRNSSELTAKRDLEKYFPIDLEKLLMIAKKEYFVAECIELPFSSIFFYNSKVGKSSFDGRFYILYFGYDKLQKMFSLSHEIGHIALGHFNNSSFPIEQEEYEADLYSSIILNRPIKELSTLLKENLLKYSHPFLDEFKSCFSKRSRQFRKMLDSKGLTPLYKNF